MGVFWIAMALTLAFHQEGHANSARAHKAGDHGTRHETESLPLESYDVIIAHSTGVHAIMKCAQKRTLKNVLLLGATPYHNNVRSEILTGWFDEPWDYAQIKKNVSKIVICNGRNDPYITPLEAKELGYKLSCKVYLFNKQRHLTEWFYTHIPDEAGIYRDNIVLKKVIEEFYYN